MRGYGRLTKQILELLATGALLGFVRDRQEQRKLLEDSDRIWYNIDRKQLFRILERLRLGGYVSLIKRAEGVEKASLTDKGKAKSLTYEFNALTLPKSKKWDKKWRLVLFDIPETKKKIRDALRRKLKALGFLEFQKSVFVYPYPCRDEINFILNFWAIPEHVHYVEAPITSDHKLREHFRV